MMKRVITFLLVIVSLVSASITCFAAESREAVECPVYGKYHSSNVDLHTAVIKNGKGTLTDSEGALFVVELNRKYNGYTLVVHPITESDEEAFAWFQSCVADDAVDISPYEIYLLNPNQERVELPNRTSIQVSVSDQSDSIMGVSYSGEASVIDSTYKSGKLTFKSTGQSNYYLICEKSDGGVDSPPTEDTSKTHLWDYIVSIWEKIEKYFWFL
jgi:hypothetical protein